MTDEELMAELEAEEAAKARARDAATGPQKINLLHLLKGSTGELHAIHVRLEEMVPHLDGAIAKSSGVLKHILMSLSDILR